MLLDDESSQSNKNSSQSQWIKRKIEDEGIQARNIIKYNVPMDDPIAGPAGGDIREDIDKSQFQHWSSQPTFSPQSPRSSAFSPSTSALMSPRHKVRRTRTNSNTTSTSLSVTSSNRLGLKQPPISGCSSRRRIESEYRARYWGQMLDTLRRTIDEIYSACETDESEVECKEVIMILEHSKQDFHSLIEKMNLLREFEQASDQHKPCALAWDERTTVPGRPIMHKLLASTAIAAAQLPAVFPFGLDAAGVQSTLSDKLLRLSLDGEPPVLFDINTDQTVTPSDRLPIKRTKSAVSHSSHVSGSDVGTSEISSNKEEEEDVDKPDRQVASVNENDALLCSPSGLVGEDSFMNESSQPSDVDEDGEVNALSRDLQQLDEAIANVTSAERMLTSELDRAHCVEAALRRRLFSSKEHSTTENPDDGDDEDNGEDNDYVLGPDTAGCSQRTVESNLRPRLIQASVPSRCCSCQCHSEWRQKDTEDQQSALAFALAANLCTSSPVVKARRRAALQDSVPGTLQSSPRTSLVVNDFESPDIHTPLHVSTVDVDTAKSLLFLSEIGAKSRTPGHGIQMHEKLSARSRKRNNSSIQELQQKQNKAKTLREQHLLERAERVHELSKKVEEIHMQKRLLLMQRRSCLDRRLHAAERKRQAELEKRISKAHDEKTKGREIAFIQTLEAEQKQHTIFTKHAESRVRLGEIAAQRRRRLQEKLGREEAAKGRRHALEASRRARLDALKARWESKTQQWASRTEHLEHTRRAAARAKEQHREIKISSLEEQQRVHIEQLRSRIQRKQQETERRHQESLREISRKAFEMSVLTHTTDESSMTAAGMEPYPVQKWCRACQVTIVSEVSLKSHLQGKRHQKAVLEASENRPLDRSDLEAFNLLHLVDAPADVQLPQGQQTDQERLKLQRKRARKLRQRMNQRAQQFMQEQEQIKHTLPASSSRTQLQKLIKDARRFLNLPDSGPWVVTRIQAMEKCLNAILRCMSTGSQSASQKTSQEDPCDSTQSAHRETMEQQLCVQLGLLPILIKLIGLIREQRPTGTQLLPDKTYQLACDVLSAVCQSFPLACHHMLWSNGVSVLVDCILARFSLNITTPPTRPTSVAKDDVLDHNLESSAPVPQSISAPGPCLLSLINCLTRVLTELNLAYTQQNSVPVEDQFRIQDLLSYMVCAGLVDVLANRLSSPRQANLLLRVHSPGSRSMNQSADQAQRFVLSSVALLTILVRLLGRLCGQNPQAKATSNGFGIVEVDRVGRSHIKSDRESLSTLERFDSTSSRDTTTQGSSNTAHHPHGEQLKDDSTKLVETILNTEMFGLIPLLYCLLLDPADTSSRIAKMKEPSPVDRFPFRSTAVGQITLQSLMLLNAFAVVNRTALQSLLSSELTCLLMRHIFLTLLSRCIGAAPVNSHPVAPPPVASLSNGEHRRRPTDLEDEDLKDLLPSGSRQVVVKSTSKPSSIKPGSRSVLPDWADEVVSSSVPTGGANIAKSSRDCGVRNSTLTGSDLTEAVLHETILCIGHFCSMHPDNQASLQAGSPPTILQRLVRLPFEYFSQRPLSDVLYPTLIACCYDNPTNRAMLQAELSPALLANYIEERTLEQTMNALSKADKDGTAVDGPQADARFQLEFRMPVKEWEAAKTYFAQ